MKEIPRDSLAEHNGTCMGTLYSVMTNYIMNIKLKTTREIFWTWIERNRIPWATHLAELNEPIVAHASHLSRLWIS